MGNRSSNPTATQATAAPTAYKHHQEFSFEAKGECFIVHIVDELGVGLTRLPDYCQPRTGHQWTKAIPCTTTFTIPKDKAEDIATVLKSAGYMPA